MTDDETRLMERIVMEHGAIPEAQAILVVEIAKQQERLVGGTEDYLVTREWATGASEDERMALLRCCFLVDAVDGSISAEESAVLNEIANELLLDSATIASVRGEFTDRYAVVQAMRADTLGAAGPAGAPGTPAGLRRAGGRPSRRRGAGSAPHELGVVGHARSAAPSAAPRRRVRRGRAGPPGSPPGGRG